jgi:hypothetical protein
LTSADWIAGTISGGLATGLCVVAMALVGFLLIMGRLAVRDAAGVVIGCFVLLGSATIGNSLFSLAERTAETPSMPVAGDIPAAPPAKLPPANYDPYAGASLKTE